MNTTGFLTLDDQVFTFNNSALSSLYLVSIGVQEVVGGAGASQTALSAITADSPVPGAFYNHVGSGGLRSHRHRPDSLDAEQLKAGRHPKNRRHDGRKPSAFFVFLSARPFPPGSADRSVFQQQRIRGAASPERNDLSKSVPPAVTKECRASRLLCRFERTPLHSAVARGTLRFGSCACRAEKEENESARLMSESLASRVEEAEAGPKNVGVGRPSMSSYNASDVQGPLSWSSQLQDVTAPLTKAAVRAAEKSRSSRKSKVKSRSAIDRIIIVSTGFPEMVGERNGHVERVSDDIDRPCARVSGQQEARRAAHIEKRHAPSYKAGHAQNFRQRRRR